MWFLVIDCQVQGLEKYSVGPKFSFLVCAQNKWACIKKLTCFWSIPNISQRHENMLALGTFSFFKLLLSIPQRIPYILQWMNSIKCLYNYLEEKEDAISITPNQCFSNGQPVK